MGLEDLSAAVSNPFNPPAPGSDDPHQGVDLADRLPGSSAAVTGKPVLAALGGRVAGVVSDRFPYGNAVIIETLLENLGAGLEQALSLPTPLPQPLTNPALTCPPVALPYSQTGQRSVYLLYAHMLDAPSVQVGQELSCGEVIGAIGQSGNALNPHLHIEARVGPSGSRFGSLAHYDNRATAEEMGLYCLWRVSGTFQLLDPLAVLEVTEK
jgi:murein DD-endopeptidase MepM/ murein hydrolase activator NlpD